MHPSLRVMAAAGVATATLLLAGCGGGPSAATLPAPSYGAIATGSGYYDEMRGGPLRPAGTTPPSAAPTAPSRTPPPAASTTRTAASETARRAVSEDDEPARPAGAERSRTTSSAPPSSTTPAPTTAAPPDTSVARQVLDIVNERRAEAGCPAVRLDDDLTLASTRHSQDMADQDYFSHTSKDGRTPWDRAREVGYDDATSENIAAGQRTPASVMESWMNSDGHRSNILACGSTEMGLGIASDDDGSPLWTQMFGAG